MDFATLILLALGLSMDAFAVSVSNAMCFKGSTRRQTTLTSLSFGVFQGLMPVIGFFAGQLVGKWIGGVDHWIALVLLGFIGGKMRISGDLAKIRTRKE
jgi:putative Mn2+ efflux pump MntP